MITKLRMFQDVKWYCENHKLSKEDCRKLLHYAVTKMSFEEEEIVLDIGCGPGDNTQLIKAQIPKMKKLVAIDILPRMIEFAKTHFADEKIEYHVADIEDWSSLKLFEGSISKAFSLYCFQLLKSQRNGFQSLYKLLKPNGEAALVFFLSNEVWDCYPGIVSDEKWNKYLKDVDQGVPDSHSLHLGEDHYKKLLEDLGFEVLLCEEEKDAMCSDNSRFMNFLKNFSVLLSYIPEEMKEEFKEDLFHCALKLNRSNTEGKIVLQHKTLTLHVRKHSRDL